MMNNPSKDVLEEIAFAAKYGFDFLDLTLEPPKSQPVDININLILKLKKQYNLDFIGHTCYYLPFASEIKRLRQASLNEFKEYISLFSRLGIALVNVHPDAYYPGFYEKNKVIELNISGLKEIAAFAQNYGIKIMVESTGAGHLSTLSDFEKIFQALPEVDFHLDIGHAYLVGKNMPQKFIKKFPQKISHVHFSDNKGVDDEHLPLGTGKIPWKKIVKLLKQYNYDKTITLEIFPDDRDYLILCKEKFLKVWHSLV